MKSWIASHKVLAGGLLAAGLAVAALGVFWFEPQKLLIDESIDEAAPTLALPQSLPAAVATSAPPAALSGSFRSLEHTTTGSASIIEQPDGSRTLRLEDFKTSNGPDLRVYLSAGGNDAFFGREYGQDFVELGELKGNIGNQNYSIPASVDLARYRNAVIWCKRFSVGFGVATLQ